jgi:hypothetical protein
MNKKGLKSIALWKVNELLLELMLPSEEWKVNTASSNISSIGILLRILNDTEKKKYIGSEKRWKKLLILVEEQHNLIMEIKKTNQDFQQMSEIEKAILGTLVWNDLVKSVENYLGKFLGVSKIENEEQLKHMLNLIILRLYTIDHPPRRLELIRLRWRNYENESNNYKDGKIELQNYKTERTHGEYAFRVSSETRELISVVIAYREREGNDYIFGSKNEVELPVYRTGLLNRAFEIGCGKFPISVNILRKLWVESKRCSGEMEFITLRKEYSRQLSHKETMQQGSYSKRERVGDRVWFQGDSRESEEVSDDSWESKGSESGLSELEGCMRGSKRKYVKRSEKRKAPHYPTEEEEEALLEEISRSDGIYKWSEMGEKNEKLGSVDKGTLKRWGMRLVKKQRK